MKFTMQSDDFSADTADDTDPDLLASSCDDRPEMTGVLNYRKLSANGGTVVCTISAVGKRLFTDKTPDGREKEVEKLVLSFSDQEFGLALNKMNRTFCMLSFGDRCFGWIGERIRIVADPTITFPAKGIVGGLRVSLYDACSSNAAALHPIR